MHRRGFLKSIALAPVATIKADHPEEDLADLYFNVAHVPGFRFHYWISHCWLGGKLESDVIELSEDQKYIIDLPIYTNARGHRVIKIWFTEMEELRVWISDLKEEQSNPVCVGRYATLECLLSVDKPLIRVKKV
jgi:hypothetical protein